MKKVFSVLLALSLAVAAFQSHATSYCYTNGPVNGDGYYRVTISIIDDGHYSNYVPYVVYDWSSFSGIATVTVPLAGSMFLVANGGMGCNLFNFIIPGSIRIQWYQPSFTGGAPTPVGSPFTIPQC